MRLRQTRNEISPHIVKVMAELKKIPFDAYNFFRGTTPIRTGNARNNTNYTKTSSGGSIRADYPYANRLNEGYSRQATNGMTKPTINEIRRMVRRAR
jgi:hypothetical protein